jgi:peptide/nickel transport system ATP-binding protein
MEKGQIVECRPTANLFQRPEHPYTQQLIRALPSPPRFASAAAGS